MSVLGQMRTQEMQAYMGARFEAERARAAMTEPEAETEPIVPFDDIRPAVVAERRAELEEIYRNAQERLDGGSQY